MSCVMLCVSLPFPQHFWRFQIPQDLTALVSCYLQKPHHIKDLAVYAADADNKLGVHRLYRPDKGFHIPHPMN